MRVSLLRLESWALQPPFVLIQPSQLSDLFLVGGELAAVTFQRMTARLPPHS